MLKYICSLFTVNDIEESKRFYTEVLNQKIKYDFGENITFEGDFALHKREHFSHLIDKSLISASNNSELYFEYDNLSALQNRLEKEEVEFLHKIKEQPWRQQVLRFYDPSKNIIEVGESIEHLAFRLWKEGKSMEKIGELTNMGKDFAEKSIKAYSNRKDL